MAEIKDFLSPQSMITPGIAGAVTTGISMPLVVSFGLKFKWVALIIGFMIALLIVLQLKDEISRLEKSIYCIINTLIIFSVSVGAGVNINPPPQSNPVPVDPTIQRLLEQIQVGDSFEKLMRFSGVTSAYAQEPGEQDPTERNIREQPPEGNQPESVGEERTQPQFTEEEIKKLREYIDQQKEQKEKQEKYYQRWSW